MDGLRMLSKAECDSCVGGEAITLAGIMAILAIAIIAVVCYRFFVSAEGTVKLPGGFQFEWGRIR